MIRHTLPVMTFLSLAVAVTARPAQSQDVEGLSAAFQAAPPATREYAQHVILLAHPSLEGRLPGTSGVDLAEEVIVTSFRHSGLDPAFGPAYRQPFDFRQGGTFGAERDSTTVTGFNIGAMIPGCGSLASEWVILGAHHDHIGRGAFGSRSTDTPGRVHEGADDNASGTAAVLLAARILRDQFPPCERSTDLESPRRSILLLTFSGEESGLNGSEHFVRNAPMPLDRIALMINLDMVGRLSEGRLQVSGSQSGDTLPAMVLAAGTMNPLEPVLSRGLTARSDHAPFYRERVPVLFLTETVFPDDYHTPEDESWKLNFESAANAAAFAADLVARSALDPARPSWQEVAGFETGGGGPSISDIRIRFGIKPGNYGDTQPGVLVGGVSAGTSAEDAGIREGDLLIGWDGREIVGVMEWMRLMAPHQPGDVVTVTIIRGDETLDLPVRLKPR